MNRKLAPFLRIPALILILAAPFFTGCATVPETGRSQIMVVSAGHEAQMGLQAFDDIKKKEKISADPAANARVQRVGTRIAQAVGRDIPNAQWEFVVFESAQVNAFALPGGKVGVYTGLLKLVGSDSELACVMGHEIAHVTARHGAERASDQLTAAALGLAVGVATEGRRNQDLWRVGFGLAAGGTLLSFSRTHESEADHIGLIYAARAGYDPRTAIDFWRKMAANKAGKAQAPEFLSTHPSDDTRIANLGKLMPQMLAIYEAAPRAP